MIDHLFDIYKELGVLNAKVIHIAGSKGKGTTAILLAKILEMHGNKVGLFTSPVILDRTEMIQVNGETIAKAKLEELVKFVNEKGDVSEFEAWTLAAFVYFNEQKCDYVILECGWGGAKDATNIIANKTLTILTHVELEHTEVLGESIEEITREKLGICREDVPLITVASQVPEVFEAIKELGIEPHIAAANDIGHHHPECAGIATLAAEELGFILTPEMFKVLEEMQIPGRFEVIKFNQHTFILDGAHTYDSIQYVIEKVLNYIQENGLPEPIWAIHFLKDKNPELYKMFSTHRSVWIELEVERAGTAPKILPSVQLSEIASELKATENPQLIVFVGSFRLVAAVKRFGF